MKSHYSKSLGKQVFNEHRQFLQKKYKYQIYEKHVFNGKEETTPKLKKMIPHMWKLEYNRMNRQGNLIPSDASFHMKFKFGYCILFNNDIIDVHEGNQGINNKLPKGL